MRAQLEGLPTRPPVGPEETWCDEALRYFYFADQFGWTPTQVDAEPILIIDRLLVAARLKGEVEAERQQGAPRRP